MEDRGSNPLALASHQRRPLLHHGNLGVKQLKPGLDLRCGEVVLPQPLHLKHWVSIPH